MGNHDDIPVSGFPQAEQLGLFYNRPRYRNDRQSSSVWFYPLCAEVFQVSVLFVLPNVHLCSRFWNCEPVAWHLVCS